MTDVQLLVTLKGGSYVFGVASVAFSPDGTLLASGSWEGAIRLWRMPEGMLITSLTDQMSAVRGVAFSPNGRLLASGSEDGYVRLWDVANETVTRMLAGSDRATSLSFLPDGQMVARGAADGVTRIRGTEDGLVLRELWNNAGGVSSVSFSPDGQQLAVGDGERFVTSWFLANGPRASAGLSRDSMGGLGLAFSRDSGLLASGASESILLA